MNDVAEVRVPIGNQDHVLACDDGQEKHLEALAQRFDSLVKDAKAEDGDLNDGTAILAAALALLDEYDQAKAAWASEKPEGKAAEWVAAKLDQVSERLEKALDT